jgi:AICAR transformylase/IMP cyclohydrolase PurH
MSKDKTEASPRRQYSTKVKEGFPELLNFGDRLFLKRLSMRYGENPGYPAAFYIEEGASGPNMATLEVLQEGSKGLSYINVGDMDLGQRLARKLAGIHPGKNVCVLVKHETPSGVALGDSPEETFEKAWNCDALSNFGSVDIFSYPVTPGLARLVVESRRNIEVVYAPAFSADSLEILATRKPLRVVRMGAPLDQPAADNGLEFKRVAGGLLVQKRFDSKVVSPDSVDVVSERRPTPEEIRAAIFNWTVACFTRSNAVVIGKEDKVHGIGSGQRSRIDSAEDAVRLSRRSYGPEGCVLASDAFMPFPDVVELAARSGITAIIYPLGSVKDEEVIAKANEAGIAMIVTRSPGEVDCERCFLHR